MILRLDSRKTVRLWVIALGAVLLPAEAQTVSPDETGWLTNATQVRNLSVEEAARHLPVRIQGVFISEADSHLHDTLHTGMVVWDETADIYVSGTKVLLANIRAGDKLMIEGVTDPGEFAPIILARSVSHLGASPLPSPKVVTFQELLAGSFDAQWVEISGVVRNWERAARPQSPQRWRMDVAMDGGRLSVVCNDSRPAPLVQDAEVRLCGLCFYEFNQKRQVLGPLISCVGSVQVTKPAPSLPFDAPVRSITNLLQFSPNTVYGHRVHVRGTVTYKGPRNGMWIRDRSGGLRVETQKTGDLRTGYEVDVLGYPRYGDYMPMLEDAVFRVLATNRPPVPVMLAGPNEAFEHEEDLVSLDALLTDAQPILDGWLFTLRAGNMTFHAGLRSPTSQHDSVNWRPGSRVRVSGICSLASESDFRPVQGGLWHPQSFQITLRSPVDLIVLHPPPWWNPQRMIILFGSLAGLSLLAAGLVMWRVRRHLREEAAHRAQAESEFAAILAERNRLAREIHDTLAQGLGAISLHLELVKNQPGHDWEGAKKHIEIAHDVARAGLVEARNAIWNMRSQVLENGDLASALKNMLSQMTHGDLVKARFEVTGQSRRLPPVTENSLLRIGQEAITNAQTHARAGHIEVKLEFADNRVQLRVKDDGCGFDLNCPPPSAGCFGLVGMRERATQVGGDLMVRSRPGEGTEIVLTVPASSQN